MSVCCYTQCSDHPIRKVTLNNIHDHVYYLHYLYSTFIPVGNSILLKHLNRMNEFRTRRPRGSQAFIVSHLTTYQQVAAGCWKVILQMKYRHPIPCNNAGKPHGWFRLRTTNIRSEGGTGSWPLGQPTPSLCRRPELYNDSQPCWSINSIRSGFPNIPF